MIISGGTSKTVRSNSPPPEHGRGPLRFLSHMPKCLVVQAAQCEPPYMGYIPHNPVPKMFQRGEFATKPPRSAMVAVFAALAVVSGYLNVSGGELQKCSGPGMALTGFTRTGHCADRDDDAGSHHVCIDMSSLTGSGGNFCQVTGQSD